MTALIPALIGLLLSLAFVVAAVIAHRGQSFWGTWLMVLGSGAFILGLVGATTASIFLFRSMSSGLPSGASSSLVAFSLISGIGSILCLLGLLSYLAGLLGLAIRYASVARRVTDLEAINGSLIESRDR